MHCTTVIYSKTRRGCTYPIYAREGLLSRTFLLACPSLRINTSRLSTQLDYQGMATLCHPPQGIIFKALVYTNQRSTASPLVIYSFSSHGNNVER